MRPASLSVLEAVCFMARENGKTTNKTIREYYDCRQGSGLAFFAGFQAGKKGASQKTIYRNVKALEEMKLVKVERKKAGNRRYDLYSPTREGMECLRRESLRKKVTGTLPGLLEIIQAKFPAKLMTVEK